MKLFSPGSRISTGAAALLLAGSVLGLFFLLSGRLAAEGLGAPHLALALLVAGLGAGLALVTIALALHSRCQEKDAELELLRRPQEQPQALESEAPSAPAAPQPEGVDVARLAGRLMPPEGIGTAEAFAERLLSNLAKQLELAQGVMYRLAPGGQEFRFLAGYAFYSQGARPPFALGETLPGQAAKSREVLNLSPLPEGYMTVVSGLGHASPRHLLVVPIPGPDGECVATMELASFKAFPPNHITLYRQVALLAGERLTAYANSTPE